jgi:hypothetical protein
MKWGITSLDELQKMKEKMDRVWNEFFEEIPKNEEKVWQWVEKLPKFEGTRRSTSRSRTNKMIK